MLINVEDDSFMLFFGNIKIKRLFSNNQLIKERKKTKNTVCLDEFIPQFKVIWQKCAFICTTFSDRHFVQLTSSYKYSVIVNKYSALT